MSAIISTYLDLLDSQREAAFTALDGLTDAQLWQRPAPKEWSIGEIINHNGLLFESFMPAVLFMWNGFSWYGRLRRSYNARKPIALGALKAEIRALHAKVRGFYEGKDLDVLGNLYLYDPLFGWCNLIVVLRIGIYHDQLHFDDVFKQAAQFKK